MAVVLVMSLLIILSIVLIVLQVAITAGFGCQLAALVPLMETMICTPPQVATLPAVCKASISSQATIPYGPVPLELRLVFRAMF